MVLIRVDLRAYDGVVAITQSNYGRSKFAFQFQFLILFIRKAVVFFFSPAPGKRNSNAIRGGRDFLFYEQSVPIVTIVFGAGDVFSTYYIMFEIVILRLFFFFL